MKEEIINYKFLLKERVERELLLNPFNFIISFHGCKHFYPTLQTSNK